MPSSSSSSSIIDNNYIHCNNCYNGTTNNDNSIQNVVLQNNHESESEITFIECNGKIIGKPCTKIYSSRCINDKDFISHIDHIDETKSNQIDNDKKMLLPPSSKHRKNSKEYGQLSIY